jgi:hypothetical protein
VALGLALALAVALGATEEAAEMVAAAFPLRPAPGEALAEAEALPPWDDCAGAAGANDSIMAASIVAADNDNESDNESFLLNGILVPPRRLSLCTPPPPTVCERNGRFSARPSAVRRPT